MLRNLLITIFCAMASFAAMAQDTRPFEPLFVDGKSWKYQYTNHIWPGRNAIETYTVDGDTIAGGRECKRLRFHSENENKQDYYFAVYEEDGKSYVFIDYYNGGFFSPLFDFSVTQGDTVKQYYNSGETYYHWKVGSTEEVEIRGYKRRRIQFSDEEPCPYVFYWIEGIGATNMTWETMTLQNFPTDTSAWFFLECSLNGEVLLTCEDAGLPWSSASVRSMTEEHMQGDGIVYDIHGRRVERPQPGHIYIRDGQKFVQQ